LQRRRTDLGADGHPLGRARRDPVHSGRALAAALPAALSPDLARLLPRGSKDLTAEKGKFSSDEARLVGEQIGIDWSSSPFDVEQFRRGMDVELEHGIHDLLTNVTGDDPLVTGKIALAHLRVFPDYYTRLAQMEEQAKRELG